MYLRDVWVLGDAIKTSYSLRVQGSFSRLRLPLLRRSGAVLEGE